MGYLLNLLSQREIETNILILLSQEAIIISNWPYLNGSCTPMSRNNSLSGKTVAVTLNNTSHSSWTVVLGDDVCVKEFDGFLIQT